METLPKKLPNKISTPNPATELRVKIEKIALGIKEKYLELNEVYQYICKIENILDIDKKIEDKDA